MIVVPEEFPFFPGLHFEALNFELFEPCWLYLVPLERLGKIL